MTEPRSLYFDSSRLRLHYAVWGDGSRPALVLLHGSRDHARMWDFVAREMLDRYTVYAPDLRGHGDSDWSSGGAYRLNDYLLDLAGLVDRIGAPTVSLAGHSLGARIVLDFAGTFPERIEKVVSIEAFEDHEEIEPSEPPMQQVRAFIDRIRQLDERSPRGYASLEEAEARMQVGNPWLSADLVRHQTQHAVRRREDGAYVWKFDSHVSAQRSPDWPRGGIEQIWGSISAPALFIGGEGWGRSVHPAFARATVPHARVEVIAGAGHWLHQDHFERFVQLLREFLIP